jgi:hypothetical protein
MTAAFPAGRVPAMTSSIPAAAAVHRGLAEQHLTVRGDDLPRPDHEHVPGPQPRRRDLALGPVRAEEADVLSARVGQLAHGRPGLAAGMRLIQPAAEQERGDGRGRLQVDAPPPEAWTSWRSTLSPAPPRSRKNMAYTDHPQAAMIPSETSVSMEDEPCRAFFSAAR